MKKNFKERMIESNVYNLDFEQAIEKELTEAYMEGRGEVYVRILFGRVFRPFHTAHYCNNGKGIDEYNVTIVLPKNNRFGEKEAIEWLKTNGYHNTSTLYWELDA